MFLEGFEPEARFETGRRTITAGDLETFAALTGDASDLHMNAEAAAATVFGERIAHGALVFGISTGLTVQLGLFEESLIAFYGLDRLRFTRAVAIGDTVRAIKRVVGRAERDGHSGIVTFETTVKNQRDEVVLVYIDKIVVKKAP